MLQATRFSLCCRHRSLIRVVRAAPELVCVYVCVCVCVCVCVLVSCEPRLIALTSQVLKVLDERVHEVCVCVCVRVRACVPWRRRRLCQQHLEQHLAVKALS